MANILRNGTGNILRNGTIAGILLVEVDIIQVRDYLGLNAITELTGSHRLKQTTYC